MRMVAVLRNLGGTPGMMDRVWAEMIAELTESVRFFPPAAEVAIQYSQRALGHPLPGDLVDLLRETNGVEGEYGLVWSGLVWPVERIVEDNLTFRTSSEFGQLYMPFEALLFFADAGNGDQFAFVLRDDRRDVFVWDHETDSRTWVAPRLVEYLVAGRHDRSPTGPKPRSSRRSRAPRASRQMSVWGYS
jgi:hypothetical protein